MDQERGKSVRGQGGGEGRSQLLVLLEQIRSGPGPRGFLSIWGQAKGTGDQARE